MSATRLKIAGGYPPLPIRLTSADILQPLQNYEFEPRGFGAAQIPLFGVVSGDLFKVQEIIFNLLSASITCLGVDFFSQTWQPLGLENFYFFLPSEGLR